jgi:hypothetical protein
VCDMCEQKKCRKVGFQAHPHLPHLASVFACERHLDDGLSDPMPSVTHLSRRAKSGSFLDSHSVLRLRRGTDTTLIACMLERSSERCRATLIGREPQ